MISSEDIQEASIGERIKVDILPKVEALYKVIDVNHLLCIIYFIFLFTECCFYGCF